MLLTTRGLMLQRAGFATDMALGAKAAMAALAGRHYEVMVFCHTLTEQELRSLQGYLCEHAPWTQALNLKDLENGLLYSPLEFIHTVEAQLHCA